MINETLKFDWKQIYRCSKLEQRMPRQERLIEIKPSQLNNFNFIDFRERAFFRKPWKLMIYQVIFTKKEQIKFHFNMKYCKLKNHGRTGIPVDDEMSTFPFWVVNYDPVSEIHRCLNSLTQNLHPSCIITMLETL